MKLKHKTIEDLCGDLKRKFNLSILEVEDFEDAERCVIGFSLVIPSNWETAGADNFIKKIFQTIDEISSARLVYEDYKFVEYE